MTAMIEVDDEIFELLKQNAEPLVDTPSTVLRRMLGLDTNGSRPTSSTSPSSAPVARGSGRRRRQIPKKGTRAAHGTLLPESEYELPILRYLVQQGGRAPSREVVDAVGEALADQLTATDKEELRSGDVRWKSRVAFTRLRLVERKDLDGDAPRGTWQITDQGRERVANT